MKKFLSKIDNILTSYLSEYRYIFLKRGQNREHFWVPDQALTTSPGIFDKDA